MLPMLYKFSNDMFIGKTVTFHWNTNNQNHLIMEMISSIYMYYKESYSIILWNRSFHSIYIQNNADISHTIYMITSAWFAHQQNMYLSVFYLGWRKFVVSLKKTFLSYSHRVVC